MTLFERHSEEFRPIGQLDQEVLTNLTHFVEEIEYPFKVEDEQLSDVISWVLQDLMITYGTSKEDGVILIKYNLRRLEFISLHKELYETTHIINIFLKLIDEFKVLDK